MIRIVLAIWFAWFVLFTGTAEAQWGAHAGYYWGSYRYWGPYGRMGGYYNPGDYRWNGFRAWRYRNPYGY